MPVDFSKIEHERVGNSAELYLIEARIDYVDPLIKSPPLYFGKFIQPYIQGSTEPDQVRATLEAALNDAESQFDSLNNTKNLEGAIRLLSLKVALLTSISLIERHYSQRDSQPVRLLRTA